MARVGSSVVQEWSLPTAAWNHHRVRRDQGRLGFGNTVLIARPPC